MIRKVLLIPALLIITSGLRGAGDAKKDGDSLQGNWIVISHMNNDSKSSDEVVKKMKVTIKGQTLTISRGKEKMVADLKLYPGKQPKAVDLEFQEPKKQTIHGIYALEGDMLKIAWNNKGEGPKTFPKEPKDGTGMIVLKKAKDK
jgi:uncharacterized protein (TIGR03067 family)